ncbi:MAG: DUF6498-containing protein [Planctomycetes bacterium]|jgi:hypothetical protein|nr:DUF6498-containing protein [Planctomycetota bacterium]
MRALTSSPSANDFVLDAAGFCLGLGIAWWLGWQTRDLVWSLWLSSLVIGYATLVLAIVRVGRDDPSTRGAGGFVAKLFLLGFFTLHFGGFHFVHSLFLNIFFPVRVDGAGSMFGVSAGPGGGGRGFLPFLPDYGAVVRNGWWWLIAAAIAERRSLWPPMSESGPANVHGPYASVFRMHLLLFFFAAMYFAGLDGILVYAIVYALYFWPWRRTLSVATSASAPS